MPLAAQAWLLGALVVALAVALGLAVAIGVYAVPVGVAVGWLIFMGAQRWVQRRYERKS
jgi:hypothetical protein